MKNKLSMLITLLDSELKVQSELGKGTCFSFELKQASY